MSTLRRFLNHIRNHDASDFAALSAVCIFGGALYVLLPLLRAAVTP